MLMKSFPIPLAPHPSANSSFQIPVALEDSAVAVGGPLLLFLVLELVSSRAYLLLMVRKFGRHLQPGLLSAIHAQAHKKRPDLPKAQY
jgi:hypothetical protein